MLATSQKPRRHTSRKLKKQEKTFSKPIITDENVPDFEASDNGESLEKDDAEEELERLVFGDDEGFLEGLKKHKRHEAGMQMQHVPGEENGEDGAQEEDFGMGGMADENLFFLDSGPTVMPQSMVVHPSTGPSETEGASYAPAWEDSDDERMVVALHLENRNRKLRNFDGEEYVTGREYTKRLRRQYERINPIPDWALPSQTLKGFKSKKRKTRRNSASSASSDASSQETSDTDMSDTLTAQPLAKLLQTAGSLIAPSTSSPGARTLKSGVLGIQRTKDVPGTQPSSITSLSFHQSYPLLLSSGPASTIYLHHISPHPPTPNPLLTSLHVRGVPLHCTSFQPPTGNRIFLSGRRRFFHVWDLDTGSIEKITRIYGHQDTQKSMEKFKLSPCGRWMGLQGTSRKGGGVINILDATTLQWTAEVRIESRHGVADFAWWADGEGMCVAGKNGEVSEWSISSRSVVARWRDEGAVGTTVLALGGHLPSSSNPRLGSDRWIAVGSSAGIVNVYDRRSWTATSKSSPTPIVPSNPKPTKVLDQLVTTISHLVFSPDGQIMAMASYDKRDALRLVHLPSCTVYKNWPTANTPLGRISALCFSPDSRMFVVGNEQGKIRMWEIRE